MKIAKYSLFLFSCLFLISCASFKKRPTEARPRELHGALNSLCLSGEGPGKVVYANQTHRFSYESLNNIENKVWSLALHIPLYGEEVVHLGWQSALKGSVEVKGAFYRRILHNLAGEGAKGKIKALKYAFLSLASIVELTTYGPDKVNKICGKEGLCTLKHGQLEWSFLDGELLISQKLVGGEGKLRLKAMSFDGKLYERLNILMSYHKKTLVEMDLYLSECW